jgi:predicted nucleic acid-binding protein
LPEILPWIHAPEHVSYPSERVDVIKADPADNLVLEAAVAGKADIVVSGDRHLLALKQFRGIRIIAAVSFSSHHL